MAARLALIIGLLCSSLSLSTQQPGGWSDADKSSPIIKDIAAFCVSQYNSHDNDPYIVKMISLEDAQQQVVAGMNYKLVIVLVDTACRKIDYPVNKPCPKSKGLAHQCHIVKCTFVVYDIPWQKKRTITKQDCQNL